MRDGCGKVGMVECIKEDSMTIKIFSKLVILGGIRVSEKSRTLECKDVSVFLLGISIPIEELFGCVAFWPIGVLYSLPSCRNNVFVRYLAHDEDCIILLNVTRLPNVYFVKSTRYIRALCLYQSRRK